MPDTHYSFWNGAHSLRLQSLKSFFMWWILCCPHAYSYEYLFSWHIYCYLVNNYYNFRLSRPLLPKLPKLSRLLSRPFFLMGYNIIQKTAFSLGMSDMAKSMGAMQIWQKKWDQLRHKATYKKINFSRSNHLLCANSITIHHVQQYVAEVRSNCLQKHYFLPPLFFLRQQSYCNITWRSPVHSKTSYPSNIPISLFSLFYSLYIFWILISSEWILTVGTLIIFINFLHNACKCLFHSRDDQTNTQNSSASFSEHYYHVFDIWKIEQAIKIRENSDVPLYYKCKKRNIW